jgi:hypothetical protein
MNNSFTERTTSIDYYIMLSATLHRGTKESSMNIEIVCYNVPICTACFSLCVITFLTNEIKSGHGQPNVKLASD